MGSKDFPWNGALPAFVQQDAAGLPARLEYRFPLQALPVGRELEPGAVDVDTAAGDGFALPDRQFVFVCV